MKTLLFALLIIFAGCYSAKKATRQATRAMTVHPAKVLPIFRGKYPCVDTGKADTTIVNTDTTIWVDCPDTAYSPLHDTTFIRVPGKTVQLPEKTIRVPVTMPVKTVTIVKEIEDLSRIAEMDLKVKELEEKNDKKATWIKWLVFVVIGLGIPYVIKILKR